MNNNSDHFPWKLLPILLSAVLWAAIFAAFAVFSGCSDGEGTPDGTSATTIDPTEGDGGESSSSSSTGGEPEESSSGESSSTGGQASDSSSTGGECEDVETQVEPFGHCGSFCDDACDGGRSCIPSSFDDFTLSSCTFECIASDECEGIPGHDVEPICQVGCLVPCDVVDCPSGFECHQPEVLDFRPVCLAVGA